MLLACRSNCRTSRCSAGQYGEAWTDGSWLQLAGMFLLLFGTAVYNGTVKVKLPCTACV